MADIEYYHTKGQQDAMDRDYDPPHSMGEGQPMARDNDRKKRLLENRAYELGYFYTRGQRDQAAGDYGIPSDDHFREAYDEGWQAAGKATSDDSG